MNFLNILDIKRVDKILASVEVFECSFIGNMPINSRVASTPKYSLQFNI